MSYARLRLVAFLLPLLAGGFSSAHAQSASRWFLAEGATNAIFEQDILVANPGAADLTVTVRLLPDTTATAPTTLSKTFPLKATSRLTVRVGTEFPGLNGAASAEVSAVVAGTSTPADIVVERSMYFPDGTRGGGHNASGVTQAAPRWILAEGATTGPFDTFILVANPNLSSTRIRVQYLKSTGQVVEFTDTIPASSRRTYWPRQDLPATMASAEFSTIVESLDAGEPIVAERAMYLNAPAAGASFTRSGHDALGVPEASTSWYFAEGYTGGNAQIAFETFLLLANPNATAVTATVTYQLDTGQAVQRAYTVGPNQRYTIWVDDEGRTFDQRLKAAPFGITVSASAAIVAERAMYWGTPSAADPTTPALPWREGHATAGSTELASKWAFAEGREGLDAGWRAYETFLLLSNPSAAPVTVRATFYTEDGGGITTTATIPAKGRANIWPTSGIAAFAALANHRFAIAVESPGGEPFIAERAMYWSGYTGGHVNMGTPWTGAITAPTRLPGAVAVSGFTPTTMRMRGGEAITITGTGFSGSPEVTVDGLQATVTSASATQIVAVAPLRTSATGFGSTAPSTIFLTSGGRTVPVGTINRQFRVLAIGDSMTYGTIVEIVPPVPPATTPTRTEYRADVPYPAGLRDLLRSTGRYGANLVVDNAGVPGECVSSSGCSGNTTSGIGRMNGLVGSRRYDVVVILEGFNDQNALGHSGTTIANGLRTMGRAARDSGATVIVGRIHVMNLDLWEAIRTMATAEQFARVDFDSRVEIGEDRVHPTQRGYDTMASFVFGAIRTTVP